MASPQSGDTSETYSFVLKRIDIVEKSVKGYRKDENIEYNFGISLQIAPKPEANQSVHLMTVDIAPKTQPKEIVATFTIALFFDIPDLASITTMKDNAPQLPQNLLNLLHAVVIGTMRGIIFSELRGTQLHNAILPVLDPSKFHREIESR